MWNWASDLWNSILTHHRELILDLILTGLLVYPLIQYLERGWKRKVEELEDSLTFTGKKTYLSLFRNLDVADDEVDSKFYALYRESYGRQWFYTPIAFVLIVALIANFEVARDLIRLATDSKAALFTAPAAMAGHTSLSLMTSLPGFKNGV